MQSHQKLELLKGKLASMPSLALAYSGGVDSTFLMAIAHEVLGDRLLAVIAASSTLPQREQEEAIKMAEGLGVNYLVIDIEPFDVPGYSENPENRCYLCKSQLFSHILEIARGSGIEIVADGSNLDDLGDYRPGLIALQELAISSPLIDAGMGKDEIRQLSREMGLPTWNKPAAACLASRFPFGQPIDREQLARVERAENLLCDLGFKQVRVRIHNDLARIEVAPEERTKFINESLMDKISDEIKRLGFRYVTLDLQGYRTGSLNPAAGPEA
ncbi:MAG: ATP-dependent sacrificial sulfur transferase LarE [Syntrophomonadaceae bacterium]|nr:ATP-dependent sacrificial sulfur transferase LarE [Syntrophomonadaceae bacterium]